MCDGEVEGDLVWVQMEMDDDDGEEAKVDGDDEDGF